MRLLLIVIAVLLAAASPGRAAQPDKAHRVLAMIYDIGLYQTELDRIMAEADSRGVYGGAGSTPASRMRDRSATRVSMLAQREAVLNAATQLVAARTSDAQLAALLTMASSPDAAVDRPLVEGAVSAVKAGFEQAVWDQLSRTARGNAEFPCTNNARNRC